MSVKDSHKSFSGIELLRFICAFTIIVWHYQHFFVVDGGKFIGAFGREAQPFYLPLFIAYNWGNFAVDVFWAVSGFIFFWKYAAPVHEGKTTARAFFVLRFSRLYPLHIATLLAVLGLQTLYMDQHGQSFIYAYNDMRHFVLNVFMASDWGFHKGLSFNGPIWSVSAEIVAYAAFFVIARRWRLTGRLVAGLILGLIVVKMALPWVKDIVLCMLFFFTGGAVHLIASRTKARPLPAIAVSAVLACALVATNWATDGKVHTFAVIAVAVALLFASLALGDAIRFAKARRLCVRLGNLTYSSYLLHFPVQLGAVMLSDHFGFGREIYFRPEVLTAFVIVVFLLAQMSFVLFEYPSQEWLRARLSQKPQPLQSGTAAAETPASVQ